VCFLRPEITKPKRPRRTVLRILCRPTFWDRRRQSALTARKTKPAAKAAGFSFSERAKFNSLSSKNEKPAGAKQRRVSASEAPHNGISEGNSPSPQARQRTTKTSPKGGFYFRVPAVAYSRVTATSRKRSISACGSRTLLQKNRSIRPKKKPAIAGRVPVALCTVRPHTKHVNQPNRSGRTRVLCVFQQSKNGTLAIRT